MADAAGIRRSPGHLVTAAAPTSVRRPTIGLVVLQADQTIEDEFRHYMDENVRLLVTRVRSSPRVTPETLSEMQHHLSDAASLFPRGLPFDAIGFACTSGAAEIGQARVAEAIRSSAETGAVTDPVTALVAALRERRLNRIHLVSPYVPEVSDKLVSVLSGAGIEVVERLSFCEAEEAKVAAIDAASIERSVESVVAMGGAQAVFISCTNLRTRESLSGLSRRHGLPILSSNSVLAEHLLHFARP